MDQGGAYLRKVLGVMFPPSYIELYHRPPNSICSLLNTRCWSVNNTLDRIQLEPGTRLNVTSKNDKVKLEPSSEPASRASVQIFREQFDTSLKEHQAKLVGLCPIRRAIYDQCFDELIRQVTVGCIEQGLLLFRIRNELRMTMNYYRRAFESGVSFGLSKAIEAELTLENNSAKIEELEFRHLSSERDRSIANKISELEYKNKIESVDRMKDYYKKQLAKQDQIIKQQRVIIRGLTEKSMGESMN